MPRKKREPRDTRSYGELLKDPRWQRKRLEILERDHWMCNSCEDPKKTLHVHHKRYVFGRAPWEYDGSELVTLCESCHEGETRGSGALKEALWRMEGVGNHAFLAGVAVGLRIKSAAFVHGMEKCSAPWAWGKVEIVDYQMAMGIGVAIGCTAEDILSLLDGSELELQDAAGIYQDPGPMFP